MGKVDEIAKVAALVTRWDHEIADVRARFSALLDDATAGSEPLIAAIETDMSALSNPWNAVNAQLHKHTDEFSDKWDDISDDFSEALSELDDDLEDEGEAVMDREGNKRDIATTELEILHHRAECAVMARGAEVMRQRALAKDAKENICSNCSATLDKVNMVSVSLNVECGYCDAMNTVRPGPALAMFAGGSAMHLAENRAIEAWATKTRAENAMNQYRNNRDVPMDLLREFEASSKEYWNTRLGVEAEFVPEQKPYVAQKFEGQMKHVNKTLRQYWQWREATSANA